MHFSVAQTYARLRFGWVTVTAVRPGTG